MLSFPLGIKIDVVDINLPDPRIKWMEANFGPNKKQWTLPTLVLERPRKKTLFNRGYKGLGGRTVIFGVFDAEHYKQLIKTFFGI